MSVRRNTAYNLGGAFAPAALMLVSVPLYLGLIEEARYGLLAVIWLLTGYFGFFDFGLGQATAYRVARIQEDDRLESERTLWTAIVLNLGFGLIGGVIVFLLAPILFESVFQTPGDLMAELEMTYIWIAFATPITTIEGVLTGALMGKGRFLALNIRGIVSAVFVQFLPLLAVFYLEPSLAVAVPATVIARALGMTVFAALVFRVMHAGLLPRLGDAKLFKQMLGYGGWVTLGKSILQFVGNLDRFVIASVLSPLAVTYYSIPFQLISRGGQIPRALASAMFPDFAKQPADEAKGLAIKAMRANLAVMSVVCFVLIALFRPFLSLWISPEFAAEAGLAASIITLSLWVNAVAIIAIMLLEAQGKPKATFLVSAFQAPPYAVLVLAGALFGGIIGVAIARNVRSLLDAGLLCGFAGLLRSVLPHVWLPGSLMIGSVCWNGFIPESPILWVGNTTLLVCSFVLADRLFPEGRTMLKEVLTSSPRNGSKGKEP